ncbi:MAG: MotE family protein [Hyphomicrobiales bacterium]|nr:MotE family protein [Hyphomicrobiales bacterium]
MKIEAAAPPAPRSLGESYCRAVADKASDARFLAQKQALEDLRRQLDERAAALEAKIEEYRKWLARRDEFVKKAQGQLLDIYARMRPDAAALHLAAMDEETAAAMLTRLNMRSASAILNEMPAEKAARLSAIIVGAATGPSAKAAPPPTGGG